MAAISAYAEKAVLDWLLLGATPTRPASVAVGLSLGSPMSTSGSEIVSTYGYTRQSPAAAPFGAAISPGGSAFNSVAFTFGPFTTAASVSGIGIWDTVSGQTVNAGNLLWYGLFATARTVASGDSLVIATSALTVSLT